MIRCLSCFNEYDGAELCPFCGTPPLKQKEPIDLVPGTILAGRYLIGENVGTGGFGIIYRSFDLKFETVIAVKEYYPRRIATRAAGTKDIIVNAKGREEYEYRKRRFLAEARNMAKLGDNKNIPNVFEYFEENNTAYIVMEFLEGMTLGDMLNTPDYKPDCDFAIYAANEVGNALIALHQYGILHRDVAPDNIFICSDRDLKIKLLDLGAARLADEDEDVVDIVLKPGYSPIEQYIDDKKSRRGIDERADIYALGATLYHLLTGIKPDESSNRKIDDNVLPPNKVNPEIDENLSNAIMKAMALEKHLRFNNVKEFLSAINGNRKVVALKTERRNRKLRQVLLIAMSILIVATVAILLNSYYQSKRKVAYLSDADISVWYISDGNDDKNAAMEYIIFDEEDGFNAAFPNVNVELKAIPEDEYYAALDEASANGELPTLFESSHASDDVLDKANDLKAVLNSEPAADCYFLDQYNNFYQNCKKMPLAIEVPVVCIITNGHTKVNYDKTTFSNLEDFNTDVISLDESAASLAHENFDWDKYASMDDFVNNEFNSSAVLVSSTMKMIDIKSQIKPYGKSFVYPDSDQIKCNFIYEWSICSSKRNETEAAERLLSWMLGNVYQSALMINTAGNGEIPINKEAFNTKVLQNDYYIGIAGDSYRRFVFELDEESE